MLPGTGTGIVSIVLSALRATRLGETPRGGQLFATDLCRYPAPLLSGSPHSSRRIASAMPVLSHNVSSNAKYFIHPQDSPQPLVLDWDEENLPERVLEAGGFDIILYVSPHRQSILRVLDRTYYFSTRMADVTYNTSSFPSLLRTLSSLVQLNTKCSRSPPIVILGYKERDPDERSLWGMLESGAGIHLEKVGECEGWPGSTPVEFWIGQVKPPSST